MKEKKNSDHQNQSKKETWQHFAMRNFWKINKQKNPVQIMQPHNFMAPYISSIPLEYFNY
jgi:hypothetical protein